MHVSVQVCVHFTTHTCTCLRDNKTFFNVLNQIEKDFSEVLIKTLKEICQFSCVGLILHSSNIQFPACSATLIYKIATVSVSINCAVQESDWRPPYRWTVTVASHRHRVSPPNGFKPDRSHCEVQTQTDPDVCMTAGLAPCSAQGAGTRPRSVWAQKGSFFPPKEMRGWWLKCMRTLVLREQQFFLESYCNHLSINDIAMAATFCKDCTQIGIAATLSAWPLLESNNLLC